MTIHLVVGASGMLGQALLRELRRRGYSPIGVSRHGPDYALDLTDVAQVAKFVAGVGPDVIWNAAAIVDLARCERDPGLAYLVNARGVAALAAAGYRAGARLVHVSTDHFFSEDEDAKHSEDAPVRLLNEYARTKFAGEGFALAMSNALVLRTNITGFRNWPARPTFAEWVFQVVEDDVPVNVFTDFYTSTLDVASFSRAACDLWELGVTGLINLASSEVAHKKAFIETVARRLHRTLSQVSPASVRGLEPVRAESLGLDVSRAEALLNYRLPDLDAVVAALVSEYRANTRRK